MDIGEQMINPTDDRIRLSRQLGCEHIVVDTRPNTEITGDDGVWDPATLRAFRERIKRRG